MALGTGDRAERLGEATTGAIGQRLAGIGFRLRAVHVQGASELARDDILKAANVEAGQPTIGLDLDALRQRIEQVGWVKEARVLRLLPDTLVIAVTERRQLAVWQNGGRAVVIDEQGRVIPEAAPRQFPHLPLIVGEGANEHAAEILPEVAARPRLMARLEALVRVDNRRWDLRLKDGSLVQLPAVDEEAALIQLEQLDRRARILELGFERIDLRDPNMVAVRPRDGASPGQPVAGGA
ncbi:MAG: cell division protein FtsQ/DivIB [Phenylobacterium sp.]|uniref:cell division protein FtsQ/DivIB n=1 Tax=Phenylobacterium sp. TaxID=1871053 RepID=UPI00391C998D